MKICVLSSGSKGNCTYVETKKHKILIDIGTSSLYVENSLIKLGINPSDIDIVLITHSHIDHVKGLKVFCKKHNPKVYISKETLDEANLSNIIYDSLENLDLVSDIKIIDFKLSHDVKDIKGYCIEEENSSVVYITDTGYIKEKTFDLISNKNIYVFESNHDIEMLMNNPNYPHATKIRILSDKGHLSNKDSSYYLSKIIGNNTKYIVPAHLSEQNNTEEKVIESIDKILDKYHPQIEIARQNEMTSVFEV